MENQSSLKLWETSAQTGKLAGALSNFQGDLKPVGKDSKAKNSSYASLMAILEMAQPLLKLHRLMVTQSPVSQDSNNICIITRVEHESGEFYQSVLKMPMPAMISKEGKEIINGCQKIGSSITYGRRYAYAAILGISQVDDDADSMEEKQKPEFKKYEPNKAKTQQAPVQAASKGNTTLNAPPADPVITAQQADDLLALIEKHELDLLGIMSYFKSLLGDAMPDNFAQCKQSAFNRITKAVDKMVEKKIAADEVLA